MAPGTVVTPAHYLALVREAVAAARAADIRLAALPGGLTSAQAKAAAPGLTAAADRAERAAQQLSAARLDDQRLEAQRAAERELAGVKVPKEAVEALASEFELDKKAAERRLRECKGDLRAAIESYLV